MKLGVHVNSLGGASDVRRVLELARDAENLGFESVWAAEVQGSDAATVLAFLAAHTARIKVGSAVFQIPGRSPALAAMTAATLDTLSGGRMLLGLGVSGAEISEGWHGQRFAGPLGRTREYVEVVRRALSREPVEYRGEFYELPLPAGPGRPLSLAVSPVRERIPVYLGATGPNNLRLAGEVADGVMPMLFSPEHAEEFRRPLAEGAARSGRQIDTSSFDIAPHVSVAVDRDLGRALDVLRPSVASYVGGMGSKKRNVYADLARAYGFEAAAEKIQDHYLAGHKKDAVAAVPDGLVDAVTLCGPAERIAERAERYREAGVGTLIAFPVARGAEGHRAALSALTAAG